MAHSFATLGFLAFFTGTAHAGWQIQCFSRLQDQRLDPIVNPGGLSSHVHVISGGSGFAASMDFARARASSCTTCNVREDLSNYWTPKLYFQAANGSFLDVPIQGDNQYGNMGGMAIYYNDHRFGNEKVHPFPENLRILAGDNSKRTPSDDIPSQAVMMECVDAGGNVKYPGLPNRKCSLGLVAELVMPSCWDGVNTDSPNHKSHVSYPVGVIEGGQCPSSHPIRLMTMTYKVTYRTDAFANEWDGIRNPFVFANGDSTGFGFHGDFLNGWDTKVLETAANNCNPTLVANGNRCQPSYSGADKIFTHVTDQGEALKCKLPADSVVQEQVRGPLSALPGSNPVTPGTPALPVPQQPSSSSTTLIAVPTTSLSATPILETQRPSAISTTQPTTAVVTPTQTPSIPGDSSTISGFTYIGCGSDDPAKRTWPEKWVALPDMTTNKCIDFCKQNGFVFAGTQWASECFCGNSLPNDRAPTAAQATKCSRPCNGDESQICGGDRALSMYQAGRPAAAANIRARRHFAKHAGHRSFTPLS